MLEVHKRERFPLLKASVRFRFGQGTFVEMRSKDRVAPKAAAPVLLGAGGLGTSSDSEAEHQGQPQVIEEDANAGQRAFVGIAEGQRGPEAASIRVA
jgi:hypothetical protein